MRDVDRHKGHRPETTSALVSNRRSRCSSIAPATAVAPSPRARGSISNSTLKRPHMPSRSRATIAPRVDARCVPRHDEGARAADGRLRASLVNYFISKLFIPHYPSSRLSKRPSLSREPAAVESRRSSKINFGGAAGADRIETHLKRLEFTFDLNYLISCDAVRSCDGAVRVRSSVAGIDNLRTRRCSVAGEPANQSLEK